MGPAATAEIAMFDWTMSCCIGVRPGAPTNEPTTMGCCASLPSRKKPNTHDPSMSPWVEPMPDMPDAVVGSMTYAHGRCSVGTAPSAFSGWKPMALTRTRPTCIGSATSSTTPT